MIILEHLTVLLILVPLLWAILNIILAAGGGLKAAGVGAEVGGAEIGSGLAPGKNGSSGLSQKISTIGTPMVMGVVFVMAILQFWVLRQAGRDLNYCLGGWKPPYGIELLVDPISSMVVCLIGLLGFMTAIFSYNIEKNSNHVRRSGYYSLISLLTAGMIGMTFTGDIFNFYVFLEITSLSAYGLVAMGRGKSGVSAFRYLMIGTIGGSFYLLAVAFLYAETGSLNMNDISAILRNASDNPITVIAMGLLIIGFGVKMALFPLHGWQPAAYSNAHIGAAPLISGVMAKIPAYSMMNFFLIMFIGNDHVSEFIVIIGALSAIGVIYGSLKAITQRELARILAYSSISQIGYIGMGMAIGNYYAVIGAVLHIFYHSITKGGMFFAIGALEHDFGITHLEQLKDIDKKRPMATLLLVVGGLSMVGLPPTVGFFSKWYLALGAVNGGHYGYLAILIVSSLLNAIYFFRIIECIFITKTSPKSEAAGSHGVVDPSQAGVCGEAAEVGVEVGARIGARGEDAGSGVGARGEEAGVYAGCEVGAADEDRRNGAAGSGIGLNSEVNGVAGSGNGAAKEKVFVVPGARFKALNPGKGLLSMKVVCGIMAVLILLSGLFNAVLVNVLSATIGGLV